ncbi:MAG: hypothetical protein J1F07_02440 [Muribaculaceae bacterium]|nr:hypothetical protein [Muribaculaceae bacterium]
MRVYSLILSIFIFLFLSCSGRGKSLGDVGQGGMTEYEESSVNPVEQAKPEIMVLPSDHNLQEEGALRRVSVGGEEFTQRDYSKYLLKAPGFKEITAYIQQAFINRDFPLTDFEQSLKSLDTHQASAIADNLKQDAKTRLLATTHPDIILELDYSIVRDYTKSKGKSRGKFLVNAIDPYTNKVIASISKENLEGDKAVEIITGGMENQMPQLMSEIQNYFARILEMGREVTVRINVDANSNQKLSDRNIEGSTYADAIIDYIKTHTVKGAYKLQTNSKDQLTFTNVRIKLLNENGTQYGVYDWARDLQNYLYKNLGLSSENRSQGLGEVVLTIEGI